MPDQTSSRNFSEIRSLNDGELTSSDRAGRSLRGPELDCASFESHVQELLDLRESPESDPGVQAHASRCAECLDLLRQFTQLESYNTFATPPFTLGDQKYNEFASP